MSRRGGRLFRVGTLRLSTLPLAWLGLRRVYCHGVGMWGCSVGSSMPLLPFPKKFTCHCAWGTPRTHAYIQPHYCHCPWGSGRGGGGEGGYRLWFLSMLFRCRGVRTATDPNARQGLLSLTAANSIGGILLGFPPLPRESSNLTAIRPYVVGPCLFSSHSSCVWVYCVCCYCRCWLVDVAVGSEECAWGV